MLRIYLQNGDGDEIRVFSSVLCLGIVILVSPFYCMAGQEKEKDVKEYHV